MRSLGDLESAVMRVLWQRNDAMTVGELLDGLPGRKLAYTTVITVAERLRQKGMLSRRRVGRAYAYEPVMGSDEYTARLLTEVLDDADDRSGALLRLAGQLDAATAEELRRALARASTSPRGD